MTSVRMGMAIVAASLTFVACSDDKVLSETTMTRIDSSGGLALSADGQLELRFPTGALSEPTDITIETQRGRLFPRLRSHIYEFGPDGLQFGRKVLIRVTGLTSDDELTIAQIDGEFARPLDSSVWDPTTNEITAEIEHFSSYAVITVYNPCDGLTCGTACVTCDPLDPTCTEPPPANKACNQSGLCVDATLPMCGVPRDGGVTNTRDGGSTSDGGAIDAGQRDGGSATPDGGNTRDAGTPIDAGTRDGGVPVRDAGTRDAGPPPCVDTAYQNIQPIVDVLLVVDNSCSMTEEQMALANNFSLLLDTLTQNNTDFQIGVTTTDMSPSGEMGALVGSPSVITNTTPNIQAAFASNVMVGTSGSATEAGLGAMGANITHASAAAFHRANSALTVILVSDERDYSVDTPTAYVNTVLMSKGPYPERRTQINVIIGPTGGCTGPAGTAEAGIGYETARAQTNGAFSAICTPPYAQALTDLGNMTYGYEFVFGLSGSPSNTQAITVTVDNSHVTNWTYDTALNAIVFPPSDVPPASAQIDIEYACN